MATSTDSKEQATVWLKPDQVEAMRNAIVKDSRSVLKQRNDAPIQFLYDTGLRVGEAVQVDVEHLDMDEGVLGLPADLQKDYPTVRSPRYTAIGLVEETTASSTSILVASGRTRRPCSHRSNRNG